jgi:hypothetical protein
LYRTSGATPLLNVEASHDAALYEGPEAFNRL